MDKGKKRAKEKGCKEAEFRGSRIPGGGPTMCEQRGTAIYGGETKKKSWGKL